jgi:Bacterial virulence protein (VirJ)
MLPDDRGLIVVLHLAQDGLRIWDFCTSTHSSFGFVGLLDGTGLPIVTSLPMRLKLALLCVMIWMPLNLEAGHRSEAAPQRVVFEVRKISLHGRLLDLHLGHSLPASGSLPLVVYASGDGGWFGAATNMYKDIVKAGYPAVGFSVRAYLGLLSHTPDAISTGELAADYTEIVQQARSALGAAPTLPVLLTGWSRGAAFSLLAASEPSLQQQVQGVIAIGLPSKEELDIRRRGKHIFVANHDSSRLHIIFETYDLVAELGSLKISLIQSSHDDFLPATAARLMFGPDSNMRRFYAVEARNHRFSGGTEAFLHSLVESLSWLSEPAVPQ